jgi:hypothetical protein
MENRDTSIGRDKDEKPNIGFAVFFTAFGAYLVFGAAAAFSTGKWPVFLPPQLDAVGLLLGASGSPFGVYVGGSIVGALGLYCCWWGVMSLWRRRV